MTRTTTATVTTVTGVTLTGALAAALLLGGTHTAAPTAIRSPVVGPVYKNMVAQAVVWDISSDATGYRIYLNGAVISLRPATLPSTGFPVGTQSSMLSIPCGVKARINVQPYNNKGLAPLAPPLYVTPAC